MGLGWLLHQALLRMGVRPDAVAGHSLGEWTALLVAGWADESTLDETAALMFDPGRERKDLLHAVIGASAEAVTARLGEYPGVVVSIDNAPAQSCRVRARRAGGAAHRGIRPRACSAGRCRSPRACTPRT